MEDLKIDLYEDGIGTVEYVDHMGDDLTVVNSARVSFGKNKAVLDEKDEKGESPPPHHLQKPELQRKGGWVLCPFTAFAVCPPNTN